MNLTVNHLTLPTLFLSAASDTSSPAKHSPHDTHDPDRLLARQWREVFWRGHRWGPLSAVLSGVAFGIAAYHSPSNSVEQHLYTVAGLAALSVVPWTLLVMMGDVDELLGRADGHKGKGKEGTGDGRLLRDVMERWRVCNGVRAGLAVVGTVAGVAASFA